MVGGGSKTNRQPSTYINMAAPWPPYCWLDVPRGRFGPGGSPCRPSIITWRSSAAWASGSTRFVRSLPRPPTTRPPPIGPGPRWGWPRQAGRLPEHRGRVRPGQELAGRVFLGASPDALSRSRGCACSSSAGRASATAATAIVEGAGHPEVVGLAGMDLSIGLTKACVRRSALMITTDSGPRHFAAAFNVPVISLFGPTNIAWTRTYHPHAVHLYRPVPCGPCQKPVCPLGHHRCMTELLPDDVFRAAVAGCRRLVRASNRLSRYEGGLREVFPGLIDRRTPVPCGSLVTICISIDQEGMDACLARHGWLGVPRPTRPGGARREGGCSGDGPAVSDGLAVEPVRRGRPRTDGKRRAGASGWRGPTW